MSNLTTFYAEGHDTITYVITQAMKRAGLRRARDIKAARVIFTYYPVEADLEDAYFDSEGLVQLAEPGTYFVDLSPASPHFTHELFGVSSVSDLHFVAAPIAVLDQTADDVFAPENLYLYLGGEAADVEVLRPLLETIAQVRVIGQAGEAQMARAAHTISQTARLVSAVETEALFRAVNESSLDFRADLTAAALALPPDDVRVRVLASVAAKQFAGDYTTEMMTGEIAAALTAADDVDLIMPQLEAAMSLVELLDVISEVPPAPAGLSLLFSDEEEGRKNGLDWSRSRELFMNAGGEDECNDDDCDCHHDHGHEHRHERHEGFDEYGLRGGHAWGDEEPYGFDRFGDERPDDRWDEE